MAMIENISGGKGASLAQMMFFKSRLDRKSKLKNVEIPNGIVLTTKALENHLKVNTHLRNSIVKLENISNQLCCEVNKEKRQELQSSLQIESER